MEIKSLNSVDFLKTRATDTNLSFPCGGKRRSLFSQPNLLTLHSFWSQAEINSVLFGRKTLGKGGHGIGQSFLEQSIHKRRKQPTTQVKHPPRRPQPPRVWFWHGSSGACGRASLMSRPNTTCSPMGINAFPHAYLEAVALGDVRPPVLWNRVGRR